MRLLVHVEGQTEETFVNEVLSRHLLASGFTSVAARLLGNARLRIDRGGVRAWASVRKEIIAHLKGDEGALAALMVDFYGMPQSGPNGWPGRGQTTAVEPVDKAAFVEQALLEDLQHHYGDGFNPARFQPLVLMYEFEGLLFSDCAAFAHGVGQDGLTGTFQEIRNQFASPEHINDSPQTAPSKRIAHLIHGYDKPFHGNLAVIEIGLDVIRNECLHFNAWLTKLEQHQITR